jgi:Spy/CpxP family protein refolding chaperone
MKAKPVVLALVLLLVFAMPLLAQEEHKMDVTVEMDEEGDGHKKVIIKKFGGGLDLTDDQKVKVRDLKLQHQKDVLPLQNDLRVKILDLKIAMKDKDNVNMGKVNTIVDGIHKLNADLEKKKIAHKLKYRSLLTDEQKKEHDAMGGGDHDIHVIKRHIGGHGDEGLLWIGEGDEHMDVLRDFDIDIEVNDEHHGSKPMKRIEVKKKL